MPAVEVRPGVEIAYERAGSGPPLVLVHGITENHHSWDPLVADLARSFDVVAVDLRGHGASSVVPPFDFLTFADDIAAVVGLLRLQRPTWSGTPSGAWWSPRSRGGSRRRASSTSTSRWSSAPSRPPSPRPFR